MKEHRLESVRALLEEKGLDAVVINKLENLHYFSGFTGDDTLLVITAHTAQLVTDFRYIEQAGKQAPLFEIVEQKHGLLAKAADCLKILGCKQIGFEGNALLYDDFAALTKMLDGAAFNTALKLDELRQVKDASGRRTKRRQRVGDREPHRAGCRRRDAYLLRGSTVSTRTTKAWSSAM